MVPNKKNGTRPRLQVQGKEKLMEVMQQDLSVTAHLGCRGLQSVDLYNHTPTSPMMSLVGSHLTRWTE